MTAPAHPDRMEVRSVIEAIWCDHLLLDAADGDVDFFAAGGDSLAAVAMLTDIIEELCPEADMADMPLDELNIDVLCNFVIEQLRAGG